MDEGLFRRTLGSVWGNNAENDAIYTAEGTGHFAYRGDDLCTANADPADTISFARLKANSGEQLLLETSGLRVGCLMVRGATPHETPAFRLNGVLAIRKVPGIR